MATQNFKRNLLLIFVYKREKNLTLVVCFLLPLKREIKNHLTLATYFLRFETPSLPSCYPLTVQVFFLFWEHPRLCPASGPSWMCSSADSAFSSHLPSQLQLILCWLHNCLSFKDFFDVDHFLSLYWICYSIASVFWFFVFKACGILAPWPGVEPPPPALEAKVPTPGPPGKSLTVAFLVRLSLAKVFTMCQTLC